MGFRWSLFQPVTNCVLLLGVNEETSSPTAILATDIKHERSNLLYLKCSYYVQDMFKIYVVTPMKSQRCMPPRKWTDIHRINWLVSKEKCISTCWIFFSQHCTDSYSVNGIQILHLVQLRGLHWRHGQTVLRTASAMRWDLWVAVVQLDGILEGNGLGALPLVSEAA